MRAAAALACWSPTGRGQRATDPLTRDVGRKVLPYARLPMYARMTTGTAASRPPGTQKSSNFCGPRRAPERIGDYSLMDPNVIWPLALGNP